MKTSKLFMITLVVAAAMGAFGYWAASGLPPGFVLPTHWNVRGEVDDTMPALTALMIPVGITLALGILFAIIPLIEPLQEKLEASAAMLRVVWIGMLGLMIVVQAKIAGPALGHDIGPSSIVVVIGVLFVALGNVMPKSRPGFFVGIRTPWAIMDTDNWIATHRVGGKLMMTAGAMIAVLGLVPAPDSVKLPITMGILLFSSVFPVAFSWWHWRTHRSAN